jgi:hypothetical protein
MPAQNAVQPSIADQTQTDCVDGLISRIAERQHGVVSRRGLLEAGISRHSIVHRLSSGRLHRLHRGVYSVGHRILTPDGIRMAAVLAAPGAVLSHRAAAALWEMRASSMLELTVKRGRRPLAGIKLHRIPIRSDEVTSLRGIRVTTNPRTLFDLAGVLPAREVERAINEAEIHRLTDPLSLEDLVDRYPRRRGVRTVKAILARQGVGANVTRSELESRFLALLDKVGLPRPGVNANLLVAGRWIECDCVWRNRRVIVELDGRAAHDTAVAFERDRARDRQLSARGWRLARVTWRQLHEEPEAVISDLRAILDRSGSQ